MKNRRVFKLPMTKAEQIFGFVYIPLHILFVPLLISFVSIYMLGIIGIKLSDTYINFVCYAFSLLIILIFLHNFLRSSFSDLCDNVLGSIQTVILGVVVYYIMFFAVSIALTFFLDNLTNPNSELIISELKISANVMLALSVLMAPLVEETLFRGVLFGTLRKKSRILAYVISTIVFSTYHLWGFFISDFDWTLMFYLLQYLPGSIVLAWCYERSGNIWAPIFLHMMINLISFLLQT